MHPVDPDDHAGRARWPVALDPLGGAEARDALAALTLRYWYPVYAYVRRCGHTAAIAQDITRAFFQQLGGGLPSADARARGRFRGWLLMRLDDFLAADWHHLANGECPVPTPELQELERRYGEQPPAASPRHAFQRGFALEVLARGRTALQAEAVRAGHADLYALLEPWLARDPLPGELEAAAQRLGVRPLALALARRRLRQRFRELVRGELASTVASTDDVPAEQHTLLAALDGRE